MIGGSSHDRLWVPAAKILGFIGTPADLSVLIKFKASYNEVRKVVEVQRMPHGRMLWSKRHLDGHEDNSSCGDEMRIQDGWNLQG